MQTQDVANVLFVHGLSSPDLEMLRPSEKRYTTLLMQPSGPIFAGKQRIGPHNRVEASAKGKKFLELARERSAHLAVTPEYFLPWAALSEVINEGLIPPDDALWVLGCESITQEGLEEFKHTVDGYCKVLHEQWEDMSNDRHLLDPVVLLFQAIRSDQSKQLVALVQFKTYPSRDNVFFEESILRRGSVVYRFRGKTSHLTAAVIICSDAFALTAPLLNDFNYQSTLIHIQLNPNPRSIAYRDYRKATFMADAKATNCHIVCLNWAKSIIQHGDPGTETESWRNIAGSTWYCPADECSSDDAVVLPNHDLGLYYAYMKERRHALLFHYDEAVFELLTPKLVRLASAVMANRNGPVVRERYEWIGDPSAWEPGVNPPESGFKALVEETPNAQLALAQMLPGTNPLDIERVLALSAGATSGGAEWYVAKNIDSCQIGEDEVVHRVTVVQDTASCESRHNSLTPIIQIHHELMNRTDWPPQIAGVDIQSTIGWSRAAPNFNVLTSDAKPTLIVYLGDLPSAQKLENKADMFYQLLRKADGPHQTRLCIVYREFGQLKFAKIPALTRFDNAMEDLTDFMAVQPLEI